jgi:hypothetical protein
MRFARTYVPAFLSLLAFFALSLEGPAFPQPARPGGQATSSSPQAVALLQKSLAALTGGQTIMDVALSGSARRIVGSDDEAGAATLKALASGAGRIDLSLPSGSRSEIANVTAASPAGAWSGPDGISHPMANHNLLSEPAWFFPAFAISRRLSSSSYVATYVGQETRDGQSVQHVSVSQTSSVPNRPLGPTFQHLTQVDFYLDSTTFLPAAITFNIHPDNDAGLDLPVEIRFSDYRAANGAQIPFHIQQSLNGSLLLDFQAQSVASNSGLTAATFQVQ